MKKQWYHQTMHNVDIYVLSDEEVKTKEESYINKKIMVRCAPDNVYIIYNTERDLDFPSMYHEVLMPSYIHRDMIKNIFSKQLKVSIR